MQRHEDNRRAWTDAGGTMARVGVESFPANTGMNCDGRRCLRDCLQHAQSSAQNWR